MDFFKPSLDEEEIKYLAFKRSSDQVKENLKKGIYPSFDGIYYYMETALLKNIHILFDAERIVKTIIWKLGPALDSLPKNDYTGFLIKSDMNYKEMTFYHYLVNLLVNGVEAGNPFIKQLVVTIYRTYFPKQYRQYKRFSKANIDFLNSFIKDDEDDDDEFASQLSLFVARAEDKEFEEEVWIFISDVDRDAKKKLEEEEKEKKLSISEETKNLLIAINLPGTPEAKAFDGVLDYLRKQLKADKYTVRFLDHVTKTSFYMDRTKEAMERTLRVAKKEGVSELKDIMRIFLYELLLEKISIDEFVWNNTVGYFCGETEFETD